MRDPVTCQTISGTLPGPAPTSLDDDMLFGVLAAHIVAFATQVDRVYHMMGRHDGARHSAARARDGLLDLANNLRAVPVTS